jgi:hypothetical protein
LKSGSDPWLNLLQMGLAVQTKAHSPETDKGRKETEESQVLLFALVPEYEEDSRSSVHNYSVVIASDWNLKLD